MGKKKTSTAMDSDEPQIVCKLTPSAWKPNTQVPTYFVAAKGRKGYFNTINDAINFAEPYSRIEVTSGKYMENVIVNKPIEIGTNPNEEVSAEIYSRGVTFTFQTTEAHIEGLKIRTAASVSSTSTETKTAGIKVETGSPNIVRCDVDSILVAGDATPNIEDNKIHGSKLHGLYLQDKAGGLYRANTIEHHPGYGIFVTSTGAAKFTHNKVAFCEQGQVQVAGAPIGDVAPTFIFNSIRDEVPDKEQKSFYSGASALARIKELTVKKTGDPVQLLPNVIPRSRITDIDSDDVTAGDDTTATETRAGFVVRAGANPIVTQNTFTASIANGIIVCSGGRGEFSQNKISSNRGFGICIEDEGSTPMVKENSIGDNGAGGIRVRNGGGGTIKRNTFQDNRGPQILVMRPCDALKIVRNDLSSGPRVGILCRDRATATIANNIFRDCYIGVRVESHANPLVNRNVFQTCYIGAACVRWGRGLFDENEFANNKQACAAVTTQANPTFFRCRMVASEHGVVVQQGGRGLFDGNHLKDNNSTQVVVKMRGNPVFVNNFFKDGREEGLRVCDGGRGTYTHNVFEENCIAQVEVSTGGDPIFERNVVRKGNGDGMLLTAGAYGTYLGNIIESNHGAGVKVERGGWPTIRGNFLHANRLCGLHVGEDGDGVFEKNEIAGNGAANVLITGNVVLPSVTQTVSRIVPPSPRKGNAAATSNGSTTQQFAADTSGGLDQSMPVLRRNWISYSGTVGVTASSRGRCAIIENVISHNRQAAIRVTAGSTLLVTGNEFEGGEGVVVADDGQCFLMGNKFTSVVGAAVTLQTGAKPVMAWNTIVGCNVGILGEGGAGIVFENAISECKTGIEAKQFSRTIFSGNFVWKCDVGCSIGSRCKSVVTCNLFRENGTGVHCDGEQIQMQLEYNVIVSQRDAGIHIHTGGATFAHNLILHNPTNVLVDGYSPGAGIPRVALSFIAGGVGVASTTRGRARFDDVIVKGCRIGFSASTHSALLTSKTYITECDIGCMFLKEGAGDFEQCRIANNTRNVCVTMHSAPHFVKCSITASRYFNATFSGGSRGGMSACVISKSRIGGGIHIERDAAPQIEGCAIIEHRRPASMKARGAAPAGSPPRRKSHTSSFGGGRRRSSVAVGNHRKASVHRPKGDHDDDDDAHEPRLPAIAMVDSVGNLQQLSAEDEAEMLLAELSSSDSDDPDAKAEGGADRVVARDEDGNSAVAFADAALRRSERRLKRVEARRMLEPKDRGTFRGYGIVVELSGSGNIVGCRVEHNDVGFCSRTGATCVMDTCTVVDNDTYGALYEGGGKGGARQCIISRNRLSQIVMTGSGTSPTIEFNTIRECVSNGMQCDLFATPHLLSNTVFQVKAAGLACLEGAAPFAQDNLFFDCAEGITVRSRAAGTYVGNKIARVKGCGIVVDGDNTSPQFTSAEVAECGGSGVAMTDGATPSFQDCVVHDSALSGFDIAEHCAPTMSGCFIFHNHAYGVIYTTEGSGTMDTTTIFNNSAGAVAIRNKSDPTIEGNVIYGGETDAITVTNASPSISKNRIYFVGGCGIVIDGPGASPTIHTNDIQSCQHSGIRSVNGSKGRIHFNLCLNNRVAGIITESEAAPNIKGNLCKQNVMAGLWCSSSSAPRVEENAFVLTSRGSGVVVDAKARPAMVHNLAAHCSAFGVHYRDGGRGSCAEGVLTKNGQGNVCIEAKSTPSITDCRIFDGDAPGILIRDSGFGIISGCHITGALTAAVVVEDESSPEFEGNVIRDVRLGFVECDASTARHEGDYVGFCNLGADVRGGAPQYSACDFRECVTGVHFSTGSGTLSGCQFWNNGSRGVTMSEPAKVTKCKFFHCKDAVYCDATASGGEITDSEFTFNTNGVVVVKGVPLVKGNTVFDSSASGVWIKGGEPFIISNFIFDNYSAAVMIDDGSPVIEDNSLFYQRDGGTIVNSRGDFAKIGANKQTNSSSPPWEKNEVDRKRDYDKSLKGDAERHSARFKKAMKTFETGVNQVLCSVRDHIKRIDALGIEGATRRPLSHVIDFEHVEVHTAPQTSVVTGAVRLADAVVQAPVVLMNLKEFSASMDASAKMHQSPAMGTALPAAGGRAALPSPAMGTGKATPSGKLTISTPSAPALAAAAAAMNLSMLRTISAEAPTEFSDAANDDAVPVRFIPFVTTAFGVSVGPTLRSPGSPGSDAWGGAPGGRVTFSSRRDSSGAALDASGHIGTAATGGAALLPGECPVLDEILHRVDAHLVSGGVQRGDAAKANGPQPPPGGGGRDGGGALRTKSLALIGLAQGERKQSTVSRRKTVVTLKPEPPAAAAISSAPSGMERKQSRAGPPIAKS